MDFCLFCVSVWMHFITVGKPVSRVVTDYGRPCLRLKVALKLNDKRNDQTTFQLEPDSQDVFIIQKTKIFHFPHIVSL